jgi:hypothetical protein
MSGTTKEVAAVKPATQATGVVRQLQHTRVRAVIRASHCCHKPPPPKVYF